MAVIARFSDPLTGTLIADTYVFSAGITYGLSRSADFDLALSRNTRAVENIEEGSIVEIFLDAERLIYGTVQKVTQQFDEKTSLRVSGRDLFDNLFTAGPYAFACWQDVNAAHVLTELLETAGWRLGDVSTFVGVDLKITLDVRGESRLFDQVRKVLDLCEKSLYRYGGQAAGYSLLDVGSFGQRSGISILSPPNDTGVISRSRGVGFMKSFTVTTELSEIVHAVSSIGGQITDSRTVKRAAYLGDAIIDTASRDLALADPDYGYLDLMNGYSGVLWNREFGDNLGINRMGSFADNGTIIDTFIGNIGPPAGANDLRGQQCFFYPPNGWLRRIAISLGPRTGSPDFFVIQIYRVSNVTLTAVATLDSLVYELTVPLAETLSNTVNIFEFPVDAVPLVYGQAYLAWLFATGVSQQHFHRMHCISGAPHPNTMSVVLDVNGGANTLKTNGVSRRPIIDYWIDPAPRSFPAGLWYADKLQDVKIPDDGTTQLLANIAACGQAIRSQAIGTLLSQRIETVEYDLGGIVGESIVPVPGQTVYVRGHAQAAYLNPFSGQTQTFNLQVAADLRVDEIKIDLKDSKTIYDFKVSTLSKHTPQDQDIVLLDTADKGKSKNSDQSWAQRYVFTVVTEQQTITGLSPNSINAAGKVALAITLNITAGATIELYPTLLGVPFGSSADGEVKVEWVSDIVSSPLTGPTVRLTIGNREWRFSDTVDMTYYVGWR